MQNSPTSPLKPSEVPSTIESRGRNRLDFVDEGPSLLSVLEIDWAEYAEVLTQVPRILFELRVQAVRVEMLPTAPRRLLYRLYLVEFDGAPLGERRRRQVKTELLHLLTSPPNDASATHAAC